MAKAKAKSGAKAGAKRTAGKRGSGRAKGRATGRAKGRAKSSGRSKSTAKRGATAKKTTSPRASAARRGAPRRTAGARGSGKGTIGKSGEGLDGGVARRQAGEDGAVGTRPVAASRPAPRKARAQLPGEKAVRDTDLTIPVAPDRSSGPGDAPEPMPDAALDRRRQIVGTDDPGGEISD